ncbi:MAG TPA: hypothetical protein VHJ78_05390 [Actinomycetota bacterium]|nr:hypothetical protein [Actinomycetota bacterium]
MERCEGRGVCGREGVPMLRGAIQTVYLAAGFVFAYQHAYLSVSDWKTGLSAVAAVLLWPLHYMGVNMHLGAI